MQIIITHGTLARSRVLHFSRWQLVVAFIGLLALLTLLSGTVYHVVFLKAAREGWPVVSQIVRLVVRDEFAQRDRFLRENLDAMARKVGEMQARLVQLEAVGDRVGSLAGVKPEEMRQLLKPAPAASAPGQGGPYVPPQAVSLGQLDDMVETLDAAAAQRGDLFTLIESRLLESRLQSLMVPTSQPVAGPVGSGFGFRADPFSSRTALHTGLDFPADTGTPILAAAGGVVVTQEHHPAYGQLVELDHGNGLITRYAHASRVHVRVGDIVRRAQRIAEVGSTGRSTGPHLHFEVLVDGAPQDPARFLAGGEGARLALERAAQRRR